MTSIWTPLCFIGLFFMSGVSLCQGVFALHRQSSLDGKIAKLEKRYQAMDEMLRSQQRSLVVQERELNTKSGVLGDRIDGVEQASTSTAQQTQALKGSLGEIGDDVTEIRQRVSDMEVAVGMPNGEMVLEVDVDMVQPADIMKGCRQRFPSVPWSRLSRWARGRVQQGWSCSRIARSAVDKGTVTGTDAALVCASLYPRLPWAANQRRVRRWSKTMTGCSSLVKKLTKRG